MKKMKIIFIVVYIILCNISFSQSGWVNQTIGTGNYVSINFIDENTGFIFGSDGTILKSTNKGNNWELILTQSFTYPVKKGFSINENLFTIISGGSVFGMVYTTTNGGNNWISGQKDIMPIGNGFIWLKGITFINNNTGYVCGNDYGTLNPGFYVDGIIYKTTNSGVNWFQSQRSGVDFYDMSFKNNQTGYCTWSSVLKTTDEGNSWEYFGEVNAVTFCITPSFNDTIYMSGDSGKIYRSVNGAMNWVKYYTPFNDTLNKLFFVNAKTGYAVSDSGTIIKTTNAGVNWSVQTTNTSKNLNSICFLNKDTGFAVGDNGIILKTYTGGVITTINNNNETADKYLLFQNYPNPFNPSTKINYSLPYSGKVRLTIYDISGKEVQTLVNALQTPGFYTVNFDGSKLSSGVYYYRIEISGKSNFVDSKKMLLIK